MFRKITATTWQTKKEIINTKFEEAVGKGKLKIILLKYCHFSQDRPTPNLKSYLTSIVNSNIHFENRNLSQYRYHAKFTRHLQNKTNLVSLKQKYMFWKSPFVIQMPQREIWKTVEKLYCFLKRRARATKIFQYIINFEAKNVLLTTQKCTVGVPVDGRGLRLELPLAPRRELLRPELLAERHAVLI